MMATFAEKLRVAAARANLNQSQLSRASGISQTGISGVWHGRSEPTLETAAKLARALGVKVDDLTPEYDDLEEEEAA